MKEDVTKESTLNERSGLRERLENIRTLEDELIHLKHELIRTSATAIDDDESEPTFLLVSNGGRTLAIPISHVEEVVQIASFSELPEKHKGVVGLVNYHGDLVAVIDLGEMLSDTPVRPSTDNALVICQTDLLRFAIMVEEAVDVVTLRAKDIKVANEILPGVIRVLGVIPMPDDVALIVDTLSVALSLQLDEVLQEAISSSPAPPAGEQEQ